MKVIEKFISGLEIGEPQHFNQLIIRPVIVKTDFSLPFLTLEEALERDVLEITEKDLGGSVPELFVKNTGTRDVIILEGEELRGAKQNRVVNTTIIVPAESEMIVPVTCVEHGRWSYASRRFSASDHILYPSLRMKKHRSVTKSLRQRRSYDSDQSEVWDDISAKAARLGIESETEASSDIAEGSISPEVEEDLFDEIRYRENQIGFLAYIKGGFAGGDIFGSKELCEKKLGKLMRGYYLDVLDRGVQFPSIKAERILTQIAAAEHEQFPAIGKGSEMRFENGNIQGSWKMVDENVSHLIVFPSR